jgi:hypothetical protein
MWTPRGFAHKRCSGGRAEEASGPLPGVDTARQCRHRVHSTGQCEHGRQGMDQYSLRRTSEVLESRRGREQEESEDRYLHGELLALSIPAQLPLLSTPPER